MTTAGQSTEFHARAPGPRPRSGAAPRGWRDAAVARIGYGAMQLERPARGTGTRRSRCCGRRSGAGVNHIDTAQFYGDCNALIRAALAPYPDDLVLVSKVGADRDASGGLVPAQRPASSARRSRPTWPRSGSSRSAWSTCAVSTPRRASSPRATSWSTSTTSSRSWPRCETRERSAASASATSRPRSSARRCPRASPACRTLYSVIDRTAEPVLDRCRAHGVAWVPFFPLGSAFPDRAKVTDDPTVTAIAAELGATPAQVGLAWLLAHYDGTLLIPGTSDPATWRRTSPRDPIKLPLEALASLDGLAGTRA